jgi:predicted DNA-binding protein (MmcQ/YjbR family)
MDPDALRKICLSFPGAFEDYPFGPETAVFKVRAHITGGARHGAKLFALSSMDLQDFYVNLKCEPNLAVQLRAAHPEITGAWHMNKTHWNGVRLDGTLPDAIPVCCGGGLKPEAAGAVGVGPPGSTG